MSAKGVALDIGHLIHTQLVKVEWIYLQQVNRTILLKKERICSINRGNPLTLTLSRQGRGD